MKEWKKQILFDKNGYNNTKRRIKIDKVRQRKTASDSFFYGKNIHLPPISHEKIWTNSRYPIAKNAAI